MLTIFGSPGRYVQGPGAIEELGAAIAQCGRSAVVVADRFVLGILSAPIEASAKAADVTIRLIEYNGEVTAAGLADLRSRFEACPADVIVAAGGGKCIDAGKALAHAHSRNLITLPTVASNDAPTSKNYVIYDDHHQLLEVGHLPVSPRYVIVDTSLIALAPRNFLLAGIGDAIAKRFEAEQCMSSGGRNMFQARPSLAGLALASACYEVLRADAAAALRRCGTGEPDAAFERVVEAALLMSGLGFESGGLSIAHAMTRGLSRAAGTNKAMHGFQVAYALLVQLVLENRSPQFLAELLTFYREIGLPCRLSEIGAKAVDDDLLHTIALPTLAAPHAANFERGVNADELVQAMRDLDRLADTASAIEPIARRV